MHLAQVEQNNLQQSSVLVDKYEPCGTCINPSASSQEARVAIFLLDLISQDVNTKLDWRYPETIAKIKYEYKSKGSHIVFITDPSSKPIETENDMNKFLNIYRNTLDKVCNHISIPVLFIASTKLDDNFCVPRPGIWQLIQRQISIPISTGFVVGGKGGRLRDKSAKHRHFAMNFGLSFYTPEEYFCDKKPQPFKVGFNPKTVPRIQDNCQLETHYKFLIDPYINRQEIVITCGIPGCGKTTLATKLFEPRGYVRVNQDLLKSRVACIRVARQHLRAQKSIVVDNTNRDKKTRRLWIDLANELGLPIRLLEIECSRDLAVHNALIRSLQIDLSNSDNEARKMLPPVAFGGFLKAYQKPLKSEGFESVTSIPFRYFGENWNEYSLFYS